MENMIAGTFDDPGLNDSLSDTRIALQPMSERLRPGRREDCRSSRLLETTRCAIQIYGLADTFVRRGMNKKKNKIMVDRNNFLISRMKPRSRLMPRSGNFGFGAGTSRQYGTRPNLTPANYELLMAMNRRKTGPHSSSRCPDFPSGVRRFRGSVGGASGDRSRGHSQQIAVAGKSGFSCGNPRSGVILQYLRPYLNIYETGGLIRSAVRRFFVVRNVPVASRPRCRRRRHS